MEVKRTVYFRINARVDSRSLTWLFICEPGTTVDLMKLMGLLQSYHADGNYFIGRALKDTKSQNLVNLFLQ